MAYKKKNIAFGAFFRFLFPESLWTRRFTVVWLCCLATVLAFDVLWCSQTTFRGLGMAGTWVNALTLSTLMALPVVLTRRIWPQITLMALVDLLLRTYNVPDSTLFVDGKDVNTLSIHSVRAACAYVPQDNFLFSDTIAHNIGFGVDDASPEMIDHAASLADVRDNIVDFKDGYETVLGERGVTVSGGQKQRISIARALLKDAPILILDDSVSAVDTRTEKIILDNLKSSRANKTTLLIAHRISTVERLDKIIFLDDGKIEAVGPHDELYTSCPKYRRMVDLQRLEDEAGGDDNA